MTGTGEPEILSMISRVELTRPPGVFISINMAWSLRRWASSIAREMYSALMGWMVSLTVILRISADTGVVRIIATAMARNGKRDWCMLIFFFIPHPRKIFVFFGLHGVSMPCSG